MTRVLLVHVRASCVVSLPRRDAGEQEEEEEGVALQVLPAPPTNFLLFWGDVPIFDSFMWCVTLGMRWRGLEGRKPLNCKVACRVRLISLWHLESPLQSM